MDSLTIRQLTECPTRARKDGTVQGINQDCAANPYSFKLRKCATCRHIAGRRGNRTRPAATSRSQTGALIWSSAHADVSVVRHVAVNDGELGQQDEDEFVTFQVTKVMMPQEIARQRNATEGDDEQKTFRRPLLKGRKKQSYTVEHKEVGVKSAREQGVLVRCLKSFLALSSTRWISRAFSITA